VVIIPVHECTNDGKPGYKYGEAGHCYTYTTGDEESRKHAKQKAYMQAAAIAAQTGEAVKDALSDCVNRKLKILLNEGYERDRALAIAYSMCNEKQQKSFTDPFPDGEPKVLQDSALIRALQLDIFTVQDAAALYMAHADKVLDPEVKETLERIAREEIVHVDEFEDLLDSITGGAYSEAVEEGGSEVQGSVHKLFYSKIKKVDDLLHWVTGVVLEPDTVDAQGDQITKEDVRKAMESFMLKSQVVGHQHKEKAKASVVETYLAPMDFRLDGKEPVRKGSWVMTVKVFDPDI
jgi:rubrerythrin